MDGRENRAENVVSHRKSQLEPEVIAWHDLISADVEGSLRFYNRVLGWDSRTLVSKSGASRFIMVSDGQPVAGIAELQSTEKIANKWIPFVTVSDVKSALRSAEKGGCRVATKPVPYPEFGILGAVADNQGATFAVIEGHEFGDTLDWSAGTASVPGQFCWEEIVTDAPHATMAFYSEIFGWRPDTAGNGEAGAGWTLHKGETPVAGVQPIPKGEVKPFWLCYVAVKDVAETAQKAIDCGGGLLTEFNGIEAHGTFALLRDSQDGVFAVKAK